VTGNPAGVRSAGARAPAGRDARPGPVGPSTSDFEYELPESLIARHPAARRDESRLLVLDRSADALRDLRFRDLVSLVPTGDALVLNDTRVFPARLRGRKPSGARAEILLLRREDGDPEGRTWRALVRPGGKLKPGRRVAVAPGLDIAILDSTPDGGRIVRLEGAGDPLELIERHGEVPLPPYLDREPEPEDRERYQTVYAEHTGSVAAPTAGLHFTRGLLERLAERGVEIVRITLHVGVGTFRPVSAGRPEEHELEAERFRVSPAAAERLNRVRASGGAVWAVGTTAARALETVADDGGHFAPAEAETELFIHPPYRFRAVDHLVTNFHLPRSSLLMLVSALAGRERVLASYRHAVERGYRFYSYGDAMVVL
jgi:S-adenosylmethionine:tRNA ribosyltransferase-isomerase